MPSLIQQTTSILRGLWQLSNHRHDWDGKHSCKDISASNGHKLLQTHQLGVALKQAMAIESVDTSTCQAPVDIQQGHLVSQERHEKNAFTIQSSLQRLILQCDQSKKEQQNHFKGEQKETPSQQKFNSVPSILHASDTYFSKKFKSYTYKSTSKTKT